MRLMDYRQRLQEISEFLSPLTQIWQHEIMLRYPDPFSGYPQDWISELGQFREPSEIIALEKKEVSHLIHHPELLAFYQRIEELALVEKIPHFPPMPDTKKLYLYMIPKKQHEIKRLAPFIKWYAEKNQAKKIIDIGGGIGLLAQTLANEFNLDVMTVDMDPVLQKTGSSRQKPEGRLKYMNLKVAGDNKSFNELLNSEVMTIGLHTCGDLALEQIKSSAENKINSLINFGCCYQKLSPAGQNISRFAQNLSNKIFMSKFALTLSARAHRKMNEKDFNLKMKVKHYRYALHILLHDQYHQHTLVTLGNSPARLYNEEFATYTQEQLSRVQIPLKHTPEELNAFFEMPETQKMVWHMIVAGLIRNATGRLLELYLLLDRLIWLEEAGYQCQLKEFFDEETSPRNLGLMAQLSKS